DEARLKVEELAHRDGYRYIHSANEPLLVAGVGTVGLEILEDLPDVDFIFAPVGGGSGAAGISIVARAANPRIQVIGVQSDKAPAAYLSWKQGNLVETDSCETFADGLATRCAFQLTQEILRQNLADFVLVSEEELERSIVLLLEKTHNLAEGAGAAALAGALKCRDRVAGKKVVVELSGGNLTATKLREILQKHNVGSNP
ncbi:MAG: pyridoxal-phosphate dependent enzyme, partial [Acidobacteria bacterium]|nr:pyridoxal-phosphate dependent enzyme [Acidobacteriota bacterium]